MINTGLLVLRVVLGIVMMGHGSQKLLGWFGGSGLAGANKMVSSMGFHPVWMWAWLSGLTEFGGGLLLLLGFLSPLGSIGIMAAMSTAIIKVHWKNGFWNSKRGLEYPLVNLTAALALGLTGPGAYSLDALLHFSLPEPISILIGLVAIVLVTLLRDLTRSSTGIQQTTSQVGK